MILQNGCRGLSNRSVARRSRQRNAEPRGGAVTAVDLLLTMLVLGVIMIAVTVVVGALFALAINRIL